ncbi:MAG: YMGG-like glycine zipper-containing protein [Candidatus Ratteibacteria bacterium]|jgi:uncharacterized protein YcfJ
MKWIGVGLIGALLLMSGCTMIDDMSTRTKTGAGIGAVAGGILGALIDDNRPWRGAIIGAAVGAVGGGWIGKQTEKSTTPADVSANADVVAQAGKEAAKQNAVVKYSRTTNTGVNEEIVATPGAQKGTMRTVTIQYFRNGTLISTETGDFPIA